jgi:hypothetical protein
MTAIEARPPAGAMVTSATDEARARALARARPTTQNYTLPARMERAAKLVAEDALTDEEIIARVPVKSRKTLHTWKRRPDFAGRVAQLREEFRRRVLSEAFADKVERVRALNSVAAALLTQMSQAEYQAAIGMTDSGEPIMAFDPGRLREFRAYLEQIAVEVGDRDKQAAGGVNVGVAVKVYTDGRMTDIFDAEAWSSDRDAG